MSSRLLVFMPWLKMAALIYILLLITFPFFFSIFGSLLGGKIALSCCLGLCTGRRVLYCFGLFGEFAEPEQCIILGAFRFHLHFQSIPTLDDLSQSTYPNNLYCLNFIVGSFRRRKENRCRLLDLRMLNFC